MCSIEDWLWNAKVYSFVLYIAFVGDKGSSGQDDEERQATYNRIEIGDRNYLATAYLPVRTHMSTSIEEFRI